ncbi:unnamed protein product [Rotaria socialis]|uniref:Uncharacterized protein n=1 Tax=Rotaria socialis TaxID=392032 RepID=A0A821JGT2_9BILA|nr:unnamed protein product [Rotaria socialis]
MKTKQSTILHYWNNGHRSPATIARITKIPIRTVKYNIIKIKNQSTIEDRSRKITANDDKLALGQWIRRDTIARTGTKTTSWSRSECVQMDSATSTQTNGLQQYFVPMEHQC